VNNLGQYGRWAFVEFTDVYEMQDDFAKKVEAEFNRMIEPFVGPDTAMGS
jgi:type III restriction enzyme